MGDNWLRPIESRNSGKELESAQLAAFALCWMDGFEQRPQRTLWAADPEAANHLPSAEGNLNSNYPACQMAMAAARFTMARMALYTVSDEVRGLVASGLPFKVISNSPKAPRART